MGSLGPVELLGPIGSSIIYKPGEFLIVDFPPQLAQLTQLTQLTQMTQLARMTQ